MAEFIVLLPQMIFRYEDRSIETGDTEKEEEEVRGASRLRWRLRLV